MTLKPPYKQYEGKWLSQWPEITSPLYFIAKFVEVIKVYEDGTPILLLLVVNEYGISNLNWSPEPSFIYENVSSEKRHEIIIGAFKGFYH